MVPSSGYPPSGSGSSLRATLLKDMCYSPEDALSFDEVIRDVRRIIERTCQFATDNSFLAITSRFDVWPARCLKPSRGHIN
jgi:hypothetical protein